MELVSIIVPVYNVEKYLWGCLNSLVDQTHKNLQIILVDDGSVDASGEICEEFARRDSRISVIHQENAGVSTARNAGLALAAGKYVTFVDADDMLEPHAIETALEYLLKDGADLVTYGWKKIYGADERSENIWECETVFDDIPAVVRMMLEHYRACGGGYPWNKLWHRDIFGQTIPGFDPQLYYFEDLEWVIRLVLRTRRISVCPHCLYNYYIRETSATNSPEKAERRELGYHRSVEKIIQNLEELTEVQAWFSEKYYPEIVNGVINAWQHKWPGLQKALLERMNAVRGEILRAKRISPAIKLRCILLHLLDRLHLL